LGNDRKVDPVTWKRESSTGGKSLSSNATRIHLRINTVYLNGYFH